MAIGRFEPPQSGSTTQSGVGRAGLGHLSAETHGQLQQLISDSNAGRDARGPVRELQSMVGDHWGSLLILLLHFGPLRFSVLQRIVALMDDHGISRRMLSLKLRTLQRDGLVLRNVVQAVPPQVEYSLTPLGQEFWQRLFSLVSWLNTRRGEVEAARAEYARAMLNKETADE